MNDLSESSSTAPARRALAAVTARAIILAASGLTGVRARWSGGGPQAEPTLYFANHSSHGDFILLWASLPGELRARTRPVAGEDYWLASRLRQFIGRDVFRALMIRRDGGAAADASGTVDPVAQMHQTLEAGDSLIMFPEGTRNTGDDLLLPFKSGLYHLARACPQARLVPVWIENLRRVLPKGTVIPIPLACSVNFGPALFLDAGEDKTRFLARARLALLDQRPPSEQDESQGRQEASA